VKTKLSHWIHQLQQGRVLVVGDLVIDEMVYGTSHRLSREAPVMILRHEKDDIILGAAGNAAHNVARLNARKAAIVGVAGTDYYFSHLSKALQRDGIETEGLIQDPSRPTSTKTRISGIANHSVTQQIVRIDRESNAPLSPEIEGKVLETLERLAPQFDALLLSDYGLGVFTPNVINRCRQLAQQHQLLMTVDSQQDMRLFQKATVLTPNQPEAEKQLGYSIDDPKALRCGGMELLKQTNAKSVLITRGAQGMSLFEAQPDGMSPTQTDIPVFNHSAVFDVTGAGDTVVATFTLAHATGAPLVQAAMLGNLAASIVVKRFGAATTTPAELQMALDDLDEDLLTVTSVPCE